MSRRKKVQDVLEEEPEEVIDFFEPKEIPFELIVSEDEFDSKKFDKLIWTKGTFFSSGKRMFSIKISGRK